MPDQETFYALMIYGLPAAAVCGAWWWWTARTSRATRVARLRAAEEGLHLPSSLHPAINPNRCLGCATCVSACPEEMVLGLIDGKAAVVEVANCVGHGACREACPTDAISLVLGTETRPIEIPELTPDFETSIPGIFAAGELGGMGLIRNAIEQGRQAIASVSRLPEVGRGGLDVVIVGAGPAGLSAALEAKRRGLRALTLDQDRMGGAVAHYPRRKLVLTAPVELPPVGRIAGHISKEELLSLWSKAESSADLEVRTHEKVTDIQRLDDGRHKVVTEKGEFVSRAVVLAIGRRGTPRKLGVPGEDRSKVVYALEDATEHRGRRVLVVGGGDSALEAALQLAEQPDCDVTLSYRGESFGRAKSSNRERIAQMIDAGRGAAWLPSQVLEIGAETVRIETDNGEKTIPNDLVVVCAGGVLPTGFLSSIGVRTEVKRGTPIH